MLHLPIAHGRSNMESNVLRLRARIFGIAEEAARVERGWSVLVRRLEDAERVLAAGDVREAEALCLLSEQEITDNLGPQPTPE